MIGEWGRAVPLEFRICDDMTDLEMSQNALKMATNPVSLINFIQFQSVRMSLFSCLLRPVALWTENSQVLSYVQHRSLDSTLESTRLMLLAVQQVLASEEASSCKYKRIHSNRLPTNFSG